MQGYVCFQMVTLVVANWGIIMTGCKTNTWVYFAGFSVFLAIMTNRLHSYIKQKQTLEEATNLDKQQQQKEQGK